MFFLPGIGPGVATDSDEVGLVATASPLLAAMLWGEEADLGAKADSADSLGSEVPSSPSSSGENFDITPL